MRGWRMGQLLTVLVASPFIQLPARAARRPQASCAGAGWDASHCFGHLLKKKPMCDWAASACAPPPVPTSAASCLDEQPSCPACPRPPRWQGGGSAALQVCCQPGLPQGSGARGRRCDRPTGAAGRVTCICMPRERSLPCWCHEPTGCLALTSQSFFASEQATSPPPPPPPFQTGAVQSLRAAVAGSSGVIFAASGSGYWSGKEVDYQVRPGACSRC